MNAFFIDIFNRALLATLIFFFFLTKMVQAVK